MFGIHFKGRLSGPTPWHVEGEVTFGLLFFDVTIGFSATWGDPPTTIASATEDLRALIVKELDALPNWQVSFTEHQHQFVSLKNLEDEVTTPLVLHPFGELLFSQRTLPFNYTIEKYGSKKPKDDKTFKISEVKIGEDTNLFSLEKEFFAPGHYTKLSEKEKLKRKSYEEMDSGFRLSDSGKLLTGPNELEPTVMDYELNYTEDDFVPPRFKIPNIGFKQMSRHAAISQSEIAWSKSAMNAKNKPEEVVLDKGGYTIAKTTDMKEFEVQFRGSTLAGINETYNRLVGENPDLASELQIVQSFEVIH